ncbi:MAG: L-seryl-tRNA(Sec) selenium transferase [Firmicutes bacterium]|mgnify:CR=1 FL=1|nr:L-seryl-tRNA(Sec) selenium transferase [Bacillota bacterium]
MPVSWKNDALRSIPAVEQLLATARAEDLVAIHGREQVLAAARAVTAEVRQLILAAEQKKQLPVLDAGFFERRLQRQVEIQTEPDLIPVINATGVVLHTNLGRAPLAPEACRAIVKIASGYSNLEYELESGKRGSRHSHLEKILCRLTGAEAAAVVNNNAAAVLLSLAALAAGREVVVARGQLVEIGGSFRIPEVMAASGCCLKEVGTTNKVYLSDYEHAIGDETALLLKVHTSNYRVLGFTETVAAAQLVSLGRTYGIPVVEDLGSGVLVDLSTKGLEKEPPVQESIAAGVDVVTFSGDKLLGGSQAGIIVGRKIYLDRIKCHPLARAVRVGKLTLAALEATLRLYLNPKRVWEQVPTLRALSQDPKEIKRRAQKLAEAINQYSSSLSAEVKPDTSEVGGGSLPLTRLPTYVVAVTAAGVPAQNLTANLRQGKPPVVARIAAEQVLLDLRTVAPSEEKQLVATVAAAAQRR